MSAASHHDAAVLRQSFAKYDADGSGSIDVRELRALMHDVTGEEPTDEETAEFSRAVDIDGDGALSFDEFKAIYTKVKSGELAFGGLQLAMDAFDTLVAAEPDGSSDSEAEAEPEPASEAAPARAPSAARAPAADRPAAPAEAKMKPKRKKDIAGGDIEAPAPEAPPSSAWVCLRTWFGCLCGSTVLYSRDALKRAVRNGCPCLHPRVEQAVVCLALPPLWIWMGIRLLLLPCLYAYGGRCLGALFRFFYEGFERLMSRCGCNCDIRYHDPFFSCRDGPLSGFTDSEGGDVAEDVVWLRPHQIWGKEGEEGSLFENGVSPDDIDQGSLGDCWLLAAFASAAEFPGVVRRAFLTTEANWRGRYAVTLWDGHKRQWTKIVVDDRIPCKAGTTTPVFCRPAGKELWVVLLEKAFAKFVGGYPNLAGGFSIWALQALTGDDAYTLSRDSAKDAARPWYRVDMKHAPTAENPRAVKWLHHLGADGETERFADDLLFDMLLKYDRLGFIMNASTCFSGRKDGLVGGHAYSLIAAKRVKVKGSDPVRLLQLRNPWGNFEWTGRWSDASAEWTTHKKVAKACGVDPGKPSDDGVFWMAYEDFLAYFDSIDVLKRTEDLHDIYLDTHEDMKPRVFGPLRGCVVGLCRYFVACQGVRKLCCGRAPTGDDTVEVDQKRMHCCGRQWC